MLKQHSADENKKEIEVGKILDSISW